METVYIATPFSDLFAIPEARERILVLSDLVEIRQAKQAAEITLPALFHCELSLVVRWDKAAREELIRAAGEVELLAVSFHAASRYQKNVLRNGVFQGVGMPYSEEELRANTVDNVAFAREKFGKGVEILIENNNDLGTDAYKVITDPDFLVSVAGDYGVGLLWDVAHSRISATNRAQNFADYNRALGVSDCRMVHLSKPGYQYDGKIYDAHDAPDEDDWEEFAAILPFLARLRYAAIEFYSDTDVLCEQLIRLRRELTCAGRATRRGEV